MHPSQYQASRCMNLAKRQKVCPHVEVVCAGMVGWRGEKKGEGEKGAG